MPAQRSVLVGDVLDLWHAGPLQQGADEQSVMDVLRARRADGLPIPYVIGHHDPDAPAIAETGLLPVTPRRDAVHVAADRRRYLIAHGDGADVPLFLHPVLIQAAAVDPCTGDDGKGACV